MNNWDHKIDCKLVRCLAGVVLKKSLFWKKKTKKQKVQDVCACFGEENVNNQIQCSDYWHTFIRCAQVIWSKWSITGSLTAALQVWTVAFML